MAEQNSGPRYWRSLDDLAQTPEFIDQVNREFGPEASEMNEVDRRHFMKIMAASFALGGIGFSGCRRPEAHILPHSKAPEHLVPGEALYYASSFSVRGESVPVLVETHTGRPTKLEGNKTYTPYNGGTTGKAQASILELYDPDRSTRHQKGDVTLSDAAVEDFIVSLRSKLAEEGGSGAAVLTEKSSSPTRLRLKKAFKAAYPEAVWAEYEPVAVDNAAKAAAAVVGPNLLPRYDFTHAKRILSVAGDFLGEDQGHLMFTKQFADTRRVRSTKDEMNRLYIVESNFSSTGAMADHRKRLAPGQMMSFLAALALELELGVEGNELKPILTPLADSLDTATREWISKCAVDLAHHKGESAVYLGSDLSPEAQALGLLINEKLGNLSKTLNFVEVDADASASIDELAKAIESGEINTLVISGGNPVYNAPAGLGFGDLLEKVETVVRLGYYFDETSSKSSYHISQAHFLESWGDGRTYKGDVVAQQPMILPLFNGLSEIELLARFVGAKNTDGHSQVVETFGGASRIFDKFLHDGYKADSSYTAVRSLVSGVKVANFIVGYEAPAATSKDSLEVLFVNDSSVDDGRYCNNGWLQECPDPMTKLTWDNAILVSPMLAEELQIVASDSLVQVARKNPNKVKDGRVFAPVATISVGGKSITGAIQIMPGLDNFTVVLPLGYGRQVIGNVGKGSGFDAYQIRVNDTSYASGATIELTGEEYQLASTQEHWSMEGRAIIREANKDYYKKSPDWVAGMGMESHSPAVYGKDKKMPTQQKVTETPRGGSMYEHPDLDGTHQWGMNIDLNVCTGCNACVIACQSENNIPIVGRDQVRRGREMHWIRMDRYFSSGLANNEIPKDPQVNLQPIACMHCETAPCETVCPVNATVHDEEGLNTMAYNRCIGTRYCANNCPYKVRRFNFFDYQQRNKDKLYLGPLAPKGMPELTQMAQNPDVSVRMRGVMEKCTYCVQRINQAKIEQKAKAKDSNDVKVPDGTIQTACSQVCATDAIVFGDISDPESEVAKLRENELNYGVLGYLNVRPRTTYLAKLRNPNPEMPDYSKLPLSKMEYNLQSYGDPAGHTGHHGSHGDHDSHDSHSDHGHDSHSEAKNDHGGSH
ncbi:TAT-variant-translocated molybdopterin oxidoreductase [Puniceicoccaceae bacterium K14]|nr:TAT-variant-translocated molybdopterin oxidoreductase [Puniceicoccaceae bacterium K14]